jgi:hypothetical protein
VYFLIDELDHFLLVILLLSLILVAHTLYPLVWLNIIYIPRITHPTRSYSVRYSPPYEEAMEIPSSQVPSPSFV